MSISNFFKRKQAEAVEEIDDSPLFNSKEDYLAMRQAWKDYINSGKHLEDDGRLNGGHYLLYSLLRKKDMYSGFSPVTSHIKLVNGHYKYAGLIQARNFLSGAASVQKYSTFCIDAMLKPFGDTVTQEMVTKVYDRVKNISLGYY